MLPSPPLVKCNASRVFIRINMVCIVIVYRALRMRKALGGGMRQAGVLAAAALYSLDHIVPRLEEDHIRAKQIAHGKLFMVS